jgi:probable F420-dependent oxidoreductase
MILRAMAPYETYGTADTVGTVPPFRFGVSALSAAPDRATWQDQARRYEDLGFDVLLVADHLGAMFPPLVPLVSAADATERLRVGTLVLNNDFWHPVLLARDAAAVDVLTDGRLELGVGAGHAQVEYESAGLRYDRPPVRIDRLAEALPLVRRLLDGESVDHDGANYTLRAATNGFATVQPRVPLLVGGNGDRLLAVAARHADIVGLVGFTSGTGQVHSDLSHFTWTGLAERIDHVRHHAGDRFDALELNVLVQRVALGDKQVVAEELATQTGQPAELFLDSPFVMLGSPADLADHVSRLCEVGVTYLVAFAERGAADLAPVIAARR